MDVKDIDVENSKRFIINEIKRTAEKNGGVPLGMIRFYKATGIKIADWRGKLWLRWNDALKEAGFPPKGTHLRRDTVITQWFQDSKAAAASDGMPCIVE